ncbi:MAG: VTT domain-containing protein [Nitrososphaerota archaeon]
MGKSLFLKAKTFIIAGIILALLILTLTSWLSGANPEFLRRIKALIQNYGYFGIFISTIIAGSIIPFGSPIIVASAASFGLDILKLALISATGYTIGVLTSYIPAWFFGEYYVKKKVGEELFNKYVESWNKNGYKLCVLFSIIPGFPVDILALISGCFRTKAIFFIPICWCTLLIQFYICGHIGSFLGIHMLPN